MGTYAELRTAAAERWTELTGGPRPWIRVGTAMCGHASGAPEVLSALRDALASRSVDARVDEVGCLGICFAEPLVDVMMPGGPRVFFGNVTPQDAEALVGGYVSGGAPGPGAIGYLAEDGQEPPAGVPDLASLPPIGRQRRVALRNAGTTAPADIHQYIARGGYEGLDRALAMDPPEVIEAVKESGLRGRGGAAFPTGLKWSFMARGDGPKYILCNCEEGDPGAYNDKAILESDPYVTIEGMTIAGYATGATNGIIFIRHGHDGPIDRTEEAIRAAYGAGLLGADILGSGFGFDMEVALTGESYVAGEETALMEAVEGSRSMPRSRPPFPAAFGVWGLPSTINNVKTLSYAPSILRHGAKWFSEIGVNKSTGTAIICLSGNITYPGLYEVPMGLSVAEVIDEIGGGVPEGRSLKMLQTGGPLGGVLGGGSTSVRLDFDEMREAGAILGSGGIIVADERACAVDLTRVLVAFCQFESCGKCFPCRLGTTNLLEIVERICRNESRPQDVDLMRSVGRTMQVGSLCGHGQLGFNPIESAIEHFGPDFRAHMEERRCPTGSCERPQFAPVNTRPFAEVPIEGPGPAAPVAEPVAS